LPPNRPSEPGQLNEGKMINGIFVGGIPGFYQYVFATVQDSLLVVIDFVGYVFTDGKHIAILVFEIQAAVLGG